MTTNSGVLKWHDLKDRESGISVKRIKSQTSNKAKR